MTKPKLASDLIIILLPFKVNSFYLLFLEKYIIFYSIFNIIILFVYNYEYKNKLSLLYLQKNKNIVILL